jgi:hypothetical protein
MFWEWIVIGATKRPASLFADRTDDLLSGTPSKRYPFRLVMFEVYPVPLSPSWFLVSLMLRSKDVEEAYRANSLNSFDSYARAIRSSHVTSFGSSPSRINLCPRKQFGQLICRVPCHQSVPRASDSLSGPRTLSFPCCACQFDSTDRCHTSLPSPFPSDTLCFHGEYSELLGTSWIRPLAVLGRI